MLVLGDTAIRPVETPDLPTLHDWSLDPATEMASGWAPAQSRSAFVRRWTAMLEEGRSGYEPFAILHGGRLVGRAELAHVDLEQRRAAVGLFLGGREDRGQGIGCAALRLLLEYGFTVRNLERIYAEVYGFNAPAQRFFERFGFVAEGILRAHEVHHGARRDLHVFGILAREFRELYPPVLPQP